MKSKALELDQWAEIIRKANERPLDVLTDGEMTVELLMAANPGMSQKTAGDTLLSAEKKKLVTSRRVKLVQGRGKVKAYKPVSNGKK